MERLWRDSKLLEIGGGTLEAHHKNMVSGLHAWGCTSTKNTRVMNAVIDCELYCVMQLCGGAETGSYSKDAVSTSLRRLQ